MRLLFEMDRRDYDSCTRRFVRNSARAIILREGRLAMVHSRKFDRYKFPGGGMEPGETPVAAMIRETREEAGLVVIPETVREYGYVHRIQKSDRDADECFVQDNFYYLCEVEREPISQHLDSYEAEECYALEFVTPAAVLRKNRSQSCSPTAFEQMMFEREARVVERLLEEGLL